MWKVILLSAAVTSQIQYPFYGRSRDLWAVRIKGGPEVAQLVAMSRGFTYVSQADMATEDVYIFKKNETLPIQKRNGRTLTDHEQVVWAEPQQPKSREKRAIFSWLSSNYKRLFNDALWTKEWYMQDYRTVSSTPVMDLNVVPCYDEGIRGEGMRIVVIDDGLEKDHIDLRDNFDPLISCDLNDDDLDPTPRYDAHGTNSHGTKCAGEIAMVANNHICGVGIAYKAKLGGIKLLDGPTTDLLESTALSYKVELVDVYSNSWGPPDDGKTMEAPGKLTEMAFKKGITEGRNGKGVIYIFAAGNGKLYGDNCGADGYVGSIYTIPIASASQEGKAVFYGERCAALMATAYSSGNARNEMVATTNLNNTCTVRHTGTSAAAPLAAGIAALVLQANKNLSWRDMQHLIAWTSEVAPLSGNIEWVRNGGGFWVNINFGFGLLNAHSLVRHARNLPPVPDKSICLVPVRIKGNTTFSKGGEVKIRFITKGCLGMKSEINYLEHVQVKMNVRYPRRGSLSAYVISPAGTRSILLEERFRDEASSGLRAWTMSTVHFWGESPVGLWTVAVKARDQEEAGDFIQWTGLLRNLALTLHGTREKPKHYYHGPRPYAPFHLTQTKQRFVNKRGWDGSPL